MRWMLLCAILAGGCGSAGKCTNSAGCATGSYETCTDGSACWFQASDGTRFQCASCGDCMAATTQLASWCGVRGSVGGGGGSGGSMQPQACIDYLSCAAQYTPSQFTTLMSAYGPSGSCWQSTAALAQSCATACASALAQAAQDPQAPSACHSGTTTTTATSFAVSGDAASGFSPAATTTLTQCDASTKSVATLLPNHFHQPPLDGLQLYVVVSPGQIEVAAQQNGNMVVTYYIADDSSIQPSGAAGSTGTIASTLTAASGATGTLTIAGGWKCP